MRKSKNSLATFKCFNCGLCCRIEKYSSQEEFSLAQEALEKIGIHLHGIKMPSGMILWDKPCQALTKDNRCQIYDIRPYPCRQFLCGKQSKNDSRPWNDNQYNMNYFKQLLANSPSFRLIKKRIEDKAVKWGNTHGWQIIKRDNT